MNTESTLQRLVRKALTKRQHRNADGTPRDLGVGVTGVVVTIVILGILAAIGGPPLWRLITDAREHKLNTNVQSAAQVLRDRLTLEPELMVQGEGITCDVNAGKADANCVSGATYADGTPSDDLMLDLVEDLPFDWQDTWQLGDDATDETIQLQFLLDGAAVKLAAVDASPTVEWLLSNYKAARVQARNSDGAWACALVVIRPNSGSRQDDAWLGGIWYQKGEDYANQAASAQHCSPTVDTNGTTTGGLDDPTPTSGNDWTIAHKPTATSTDWAFLRSL